MTNQYDGSYQIPPEPAAAGVPSREPAVAAGLDDAAKTARILALIDFVKDQGAGPGEYLEPHQSPVEMTPDCEAARDRALKAAYQAIERLAREI